MTVEEKFGGRYTIENYSRYIVTSNDIEAVRVELSNRRYFVLEVSPVAKASKLYSTLWDRVRSGEACRSFYDFLLRRDISKFVPYAFPKELDTAGGETKVRSLCHVGQFWHEVLCDTPRRVFRNVGGTIGLAKDRAWEEFLDFTNGNRGRKLHTRHAFWGESKRLMPSIGDTCQRVQVNGNRDRLVILTPEAMRVEFCTRNRIPPPPAVADLIEYLVESSVFNPIDF